MLFCFFDQRSFVIKIVLYWIVDTKLNFAEGDDSIKNSSGQQG